jgi:protein SCO1/2
VSGPAAAGPVSATTLGRRRAVLLALGAVVTIPLLGACGSASAASASFVAPSGLGQTSPYRGTWVDQPLSEPSTAGLVDQAGRPFDMRTDIGARITLVYVGYTHCPDLCPTTMADLAVARQALTPAQRAAVQVVFISSDPVRDTPARLRQWLGAFDPSFIGLTGPVTLIDHIAAHMGIDVEPPVTQPDGSITVQHGAEVLVFENHSSHLLWTAGTSPADYLHDLRVMLKGSA